MKFRCQLNETFASVGLLTVMVCIVNLARAAETAPTQSVVPQSVFVIPTNPSEGHDPFYPNSTRLYSSGVTNASNTISSASLLVLNGLSGAPGHRLAMINGRTMAVGETTDVPTATGTVKVHLLEIKEKSVVVEVGGVSQELRLRGE
jgi:hypothetical protein